TLLITKERSGEPKRFVTVEENVPPKTRGDHAEFDWLHDLEFVGRCVNEVFEWFPGSLALSLGQADSGHANFKRVVLTKGRNLTRRRMKEGLLVEAEKAADEPAKGGVGLRLDATFRPPEEFGEVVGGECDPRHNSDAAAAAAFQRPEEVGIRAGI